MRVCPVLEDVIVTLTPRRAGVVACAEWRWSACACRVSLRVAACAQRSSAGLGVASQHIQQGGRGSRGMYLP